jgi:iron-sulfur cluster repair protein YtfE (RIC family)
MDETLTDLFNLLTRAHAQLDREFARLLLLLNQGDAAGAMPCVRDLAASLRRHIAAENEILAPYFAAARAQSPSAPAAIMLREHADILAQLAMVEGALDELAPDAGEAAIYAGLLSATLAKHEYREENDLFPRWRAVLAGKSAAERTELAARVAAALAGAA